MIPVFVPLSIGLCLSLLCLEECYFPVVAVLLFGKHCDLCGKHQLLLLCLSQCFLLLLVSCPQLCHLLFEGLLQLDIEGVVQVPNAVLMVAAPAAQLQLQLPMGFSLFLEDLFEHARLLAGLR